MREDIAALCESLYIVKSNFQDFKSEKLFGNFWEIV